MADNKVAEAYVEVGAKMDKLDKDLKRTEKRVEDGFKKTGEKAANALESPIVAAALKATASFGALELGVGGVNVAIEAMTGDIGDAAEAVKRLPAGIGPFATQLETLLGTVTGITQEIQSIESVNNAMNVAIDRQIESTARLAKIEQDRAKVMRGLAAELELLQAPETAKPEIAATQGIEERIAAAREELKLAEARQNLVSEADRDKASNIAEERRALEEQLEPGFFERNPQIAGPNPFGLFAPSKTEQSDIEREINLLKKAERDIQDAGRRERDAAVKSAQETLDELLRVENATRQERLEQAEKAVANISGEADLATTDDPLERERMLADRRLAEREQRAKELQQIDQELADQFRQQSERIHEAELADIERREQEKAQQEREAKRREREQTRREEERAAEERMRDMERAEEQFQREQERRRDEDVRMQQQIDSTEAITRQANQARQLRPGDRGFGSTAGTKEFDRPQKIESKTLEDIKVILERQLIAGDAFA